MLPRRTRSPNLLGRCHPDGTQTFNRFPPRNRYAGSRIPTAGGRSRTYSLRPMCYLCSEGGTVAQTCPAIRKQPSRRPPPMPTRPIDRLMFAQGNCCFFCRQPLPKEQASVEHLVASSRGGSNADENCVACCATVNRLLGSMSVKDKFQVVLNHQGKFRCPNGVGSPRPAVEPARLPEIVTPLSVTVPPKPVAPPEPAVRPAMAAPTKVVAPVRASTSPPEPSPDHLAWCRTSSSKSLRT